MASEVQGARTRLQGQIDTAEQEQRAADAAVSTDMSVEKRRLEVITTPPAPTPSLLPKKYKA